MHGYIGEIIRRYNDGDTEGAEKYYKVVVIYSDTVIDCLKSVEADIKSR